MTQAKRLILLAIAAVVSACAAPPQPVPILNFNVDISHPSKFATYLRVAPAAGTVDLPHPRDIQSGHFSRYLHAKTGCVVDAARATTPLGNATVPAAYMVPISC